MSSITHNPQSNFQLIIDALANYANETGIDLSNSPFADTLQVSNSPEAVLEVLHDREKAFKEYRDGNRKLISCLTPAVQVLHAFSGVLGESVSLVSSTALISFALVSDLFSRSLSRQQKQFLLVLMLSSPYGPPSSLTPILLTLACNTTGYERCRFEL